MEAEPTLVQTQLNNIIDAYLAGEEIEADIAKLDFRIYITGTSWAGIVDRPLAKFLLDLDKKLTDELLKHGIDLPRTPHGLVALRVEDGSLDAILQYAKGILPAVKKMKTRDQVFIYIVLATSLGFVMGGDLIEKFQGASVRKIEADERVQMIEAVGKVIEAARDLQQPTRSLVNNLNEEDKITLPGQPEPLSKKAAKEVLIKGTRSKPSQFYIDGNYIVQELTTKTPGEWEIGLQWGEETFRAKLMLSAEDITELMDSFQLAHLSGSNIAPDLQVTAMINDKGVQSATVIGMGDRRDKAMTLGEVYAKLAEPESAEEE